MEIIRELQMQNETVRMDGRHFIDCTFVGCLLEYGGSDVILERTVFKNCRHILIDHAFMTAQYMAAIGLAPDMVLRPVATVCPVVC